MNISALANTTVLIVDDERPMRDMLRFELEMLGCRVVEAADGLEALAKLAAEHIDLIVSDVRMPRCDGFKLLDGVRQKYGVSVPFVLMSGFADVPRWDAYDRGAEAWLGKPFDLDVVAALVASLRQPSTSMWQGEPPSTHDKIELRLRDEDELTAKTGVHLARGGMFLGHLPEAVVPGKTVMFSIFVGPGQKPWLAGVGLVKWTRDREVDGLPPGCGIEFLTLDSASRQVLAARQGAATQIAYIPKGPRP